MKTVKHPYGETLTFIQGTYYYTGNTYLALVDEEGMPYSDITTNLSAYYISDNMFALNHNFKDYCPKELVEQVLSLISTTKEPQYTVRQGFVDFGVYEFKEGALDDIDSIEDEQ